MANFPDYMDATEARIINKALTAILKAGHEVAVVEGEEGDIMCPYTRTRADIQAEVAASDITILRIGDRITEGDNAGKVRRIGSIMLIHGNGEDVISDMGGRDDEALTYLENLVPTE